MRLAKRASSPGDVAPEAEYCCGSATRSAAAACLSGIVGREDDAATARQQVSQRPEALLAKSPQTGSRALPCPRMEAAADFLRHNGRTISTAAELNEAIRPNRLTTAARIHQASLAKALVT